MRTRSITWRLVALLVISLVLALTLGGAAAAVHVRDAAYSGIWQNWGGGWQYVYWAANDYAAWALNGKNRLAYQYTGGQWWDCDKFSSWRKIGAQGVADWWIGDGAWHNLNNGWSYSLNTSADFSTWADNGLARFVYEYGKGQWQDYGTAWNKIGALNVSAAFIGDGAWHNLKNGWSYTYNSSVDFGTWADNGLARFLYEYGKGQWWDYGTAWNKIGGLSVSSAFVGDGGWHNLGNGWTYAYTSSADLGTSAYNGLARFLYDYGVGQWWNRGNYGSWSTLGGTNVSSAFIGDGAGHNLNNGWTYSYAKVYDLGYLRRTSDGELRFAYNYTNSTWTHYDGVSSCNMPLVPVEGGMNVWDGNKHWANDGAGAYHFSYIMNSDALVFYAYQPAYSDSVAILKYSYGDHQWFDSRAEPTAPWCAIPVYAGAGLQEIQKSYWAWGEYVYNANNDKLQIYADYESATEMVISGPTDVWWFSYNYITGQWTAYPTPPVTDVGNPDLYR